MQPRLRNLLADDRGGETLEYALIAGLIVVGCVAGIKLFGQRVAWGWWYIGSKM